MKIKQAIYTSCLRGIEDKRGVCLYSMSEGMNPESKQRFEKSSVYHKYYQNQDSIEDLPIAFFCGIDQTGSFFIQQNKSILDYGDNGREGNVLCQMLLLEENQTLPEVPVSYFKSTTFRAKMEESEVASQDRPEYLPVLDKIVQNPDLCFENISNIFAEDPEKIETLFQLIAMLFDCKKNKKRLVICGNQNEIVFWIAAIEYAFPALVNKNISFSTYTYDLERAAFDICGYIPGVSNLQEEASYYNVYFDPNRKMDGRYDTGFGWFVNLKMSYLTANYDYISEFNQFLSKIKFKEVSEEIYLAYEVYSSLKSGSALQNKHYSVNDIFLFAQHYLDRVDKSELVSNLLQTTHGKEKDQIILGCVKLLQTISQNEAVMVLGSLDERRHKGNTEIDPVVMNEVWKRYFISRIDTAANEIDALYMCMANQTERYAMLQKLELEHLGSDPLASLQRAYSSIVKTGTPDVSNRLEIMMSKFVQTISENRQMNIEQKWTTYVRIFDFCSQNNIFNKATDYLVQLIDRGMPIIDEDVTIKSKRQKKDRDREDSGTVDFHLLATGIFNYRGARKLNSIYRSDLYVMGYSLWKMSYQNKNFNYMTDKSIVKDCYSINGIDVTKLTEKEFETYILWIMPVISKMIFTEEHLEFIQRCLIMTDNQKNILIDKIAEIIFGSFNKKTGIMELGNIMAFCSKEPAVYYDIMTDVIGELKKPEMKSMDEWIQTEYRRRPEVYHFWEAIDNKLNRKAGLFNKLFRKKYD